jgi:hypothetical protein
MESGLKGALKKYRRMKAWRSVGGGIMAVIGLLLPGFLDFNRTDTLICCVGALIFWMWVQQEMRLKTMQIRLAEMDDHLVALRGQEPEDNLILELNDW